jgi:CBS domain-containing protein
MVRARELNGSAPAPAPRRVLVPLDGSPLAEQAIDAARELLAPGGTLVLLRVVAPRAPSRATHIYHELHGHETVTRVIDHQAATYLERIAHRLGETGLTVEVALRTGAAWEEILAAASEHMADVVVMCTHGHTGPAHWLLGGVADRVVRHADRPVLLISARALAERAVGTFVVGDVMTRRASTVHANDPLVLAVRRLLRRRVGGLPVVDGDGKVVGLVTDGDLIAWQNRLVGRLAKEPAPTPLSYAGHLERETVGQIMSPLVHTVGETTTLTEAVRLLAQDHRTLLPVVRHGQLVGILTAADVLRAMAARRQVAADRQATCGIAGDAVVH